MRCIIITKCVTITFRICVELLPVEQSVPAFKEDEHPFDAQEANDAHHDDALQQT